MKSNLVKYSVNLKEFSYLSSFINSFVKCLLSNYCVPSIVSGIDDIAGNKLVKNKKVGPALLP